MAFSQAHSPFYNFCAADVPDKTLLDELIARAVVCSARLGVKWLVIHAGTAFGSASLVRDSKAGSAAALKPIIELAAKHGVGIAIENLWDLNIAPLRRYTTTAEELMDLVECLPYDNVGVCWDFEHAELMGQDQEKALTLVGDKLKATHVSDYTDAVSDHILPFSGKTDWPAIMKILKNTGYKGDFTYEIHRHTDRLPRELVPSALRHSFEVGQYLLSLSQ